MFTKLSCATGVLLLVLALFGPPFAPIAVASPEKPAKSAQGVCPDNYQLVAAKDHPKTDANNNGWICMSRAGGQFIDDQMRNEKAQKPGACPDKYQLVAAKDHRKVDANNNGWVCMDRGGHIVDDRMRD